MKTIATAAIAVLSGLMPLPGTAQVQSRSTAEITLYQQVAQKQPAAKQQSKKQHWKKGSKYTGKGSQVANYPQYNLKAPPKGHRWVRDGDDFVLVVIGTGIIASIVHDR